MSAVLEPPQEGIELNLRRSALLLHGMSPRDQNWLLQRLSPAQRAQVSTLLQELRVLGIPPGEAAKPQVDRVERVEQPAPAAALGPRELVAQASPQRLAQVLKNEPEALLAHLLQAEAWAWKEAFIALLEPGRRAQLQQHLARQTVAPRLTIAVLHAVALRLAAEPAPASQTGALAASLPRWLQRLGIPAPTGVRR